MKHHAVPVIMYHSIGIVNSNWIWGHLTCPWKLFQQHLKWLKRMKICSISLKQLYDYKKDNIKLPLRAIILTFDDGYLDNWVFAYPLLKKYGFKGTFFVNPEFVDTRNIVRKNLEDVWNNSKPPENLETRGFLSWEEMKIMGEGGVIDIQSHSMTHTWYFCGDEIIDFHYPGNNKYPWHFWNTFSERKSSYLTGNQEHFVPYGTPIYKHDKSLQIRRYFEDKDLNKYLVDFVKKQGSNFFNEKDWKNKLFFQINLYKSKKKLKGRYETDEEQKNRFKHELIESKKILEDKLKKKIDFLCWPGGANTDLSIKMCLEADYLAYTYSAHKNIGNNKFSEDPAKIYRIGTPSIQRKGRIYYLGGLAFILRFFAFKGYIIPKVIQKVMRLFIIVSILFGIRKDGVRIP